MLSLAIEIVFYTATALIVIRTVSFLVLSAIHYVQEITTPVATSDESLRVSIIVPCFNEERTVENCVASLLTQTYRNFDILLVNDGSTDNTAAVCARLAAQHPGLITTYTKANGGKASALNYGVAVSTADIVVTIDADSVFRPDTLMHLVRAFTHDRIGAVAGNVKVANRDSFAAAQQAAEYIFGINMYRRAFSQIGCIPVISGAIGAFRRTALIEVGGYSSDTLVEDMDLTIALAAHGYRVVYTARAIAYTEAPEQLNQLYKQRMRWVRGGFQVLDKYDYMLLNPRYGTMGMVSLPYFALSPFIMLGCVVSILGIIFHSVLALSLVPFLTFYVAYVGTQLVLLFAMLAIDSEDQKLLTTSFTEIVWYTPFMTYVTIKAWIAHVTHQESSWNPLQRLGKNTVLNT